MPSNSELLEQEVSLLLSDIREIYNNSGKRTTGRFSNDLTVEYSNTETKFTAIIKGHVYLAGRAAGLTPPIQAIQEWVISKGIASAGSNEASGIAYAIATKIAREGTNRSNAIDPYTQVLTPQRIQSIIDKVASFNVTQFVDRVLTELKIIQTTF